MDNAPIAHHEPSDCCLDGQQDPRDEDEELVRPSGVHSTTGIEVGVDFVSFVTRDYYDEGLIWTYLIGGRMLLIRRAYAIEGGLVL